MRCSHLSEVHPVDPRTPEGCEECLKTQGWWVHLRLCLSCGHVGCCDSSPGKHATKHFHASQHWAWCYVDQVVLEPAPEPR
jgi:Zn-finger in ubiquitin-hydrolases and other protein